MTFPSRRSLLLTAVLTLPPLCLDLAYAADGAEAKGLEIARKVKQANSGFQGEQAEMEMELVNAHGDRTVRRMTSQTLEVASDGDKSRVEFQWPADVKGTRMLTWTHKTADDDQWLYLPAIKRTKRISGRNKSGSFMGSEFAYEDLSSQEVEKYRHRFLADEDVNGRPVWKSERVPVDTNSGYSKQVVWVDQGYMNPLKIEYYDRRGDLLKTATFSNYQKHGKHWRVGTIDMVNHQTRKTSRLVWKTRKLGQVPRSSDFESSELEG